MGLGSIVCPGLVLALHSGFDPHGALGTIQDAEDRTLRWAEWNVSALPAVLSLQLLNVVLELSSLSQLPLLLLWTKVEWPEVRLAFFFKAFSRVVLNSRCLFFHFYDFIRGTLVGRTGFQAQPPPKFSLPFIQNPSPHSFMSAPGLCCH